MAVACAALGSGRHLLLEGPVGCGKTTLAAAACERLRLPVVRVDGDGRFPESRLSGWFDPPLVLRVGYREEAFVPGPLVRAMSAGCALFLNELDRLPEAAQNLLLPALDERVVRVPHLGAVEAAPGFVVVATRNPADYVATGHLSEALQDRFEHLALAYQSAVEEEAIVARLTGCRDDALVRTAVRLVRATRVHPRLRRGASVRGAAALVELATGFGDAASAGPALAPLRRALRAALVGRVELRDGDIGLHAVLDQLCELVVAQGEDPDADGFAEALDGGGADAAARSSVDCAQTRSPAGPERPRTCSTDDRRALAEQLRRAPDDLDGWSLAGDLSSGRLRHAGERAYLCAQRLAAGAVLRRAGLLVGPLRSATRTVREPLTEGWAGELAVEATLENLLGKPYPEPGDIVVERRVDRRRQVVLMVDTSLSMAGEKMALAAVAAAVLALKVRPGDLAVVLFADDARPVSRLGEAVSPAELVQRMLAVPCGGGTDIEAALRLGHDELQRGRDPGRCGLLVSDGVRTSGADPLPAAARFGGLHVLLMERPPAGDGDRGAATVWIAPRLHAGEGIARAAGGGLVRVDGFPALPRRMLDVADRVLR